MVVSVLMRCFGPVAAAGETLRRADVSLPVEVVLLVRPGSADAAD